uniref:Kazal-like domain-containing protein n=1 Tax=Rhodnius prolixus TaxID=13249 RepID=T1I742_RHOPR
MANRKYFLLIAVLGLILMTQLIRASEESQDEDDDDDDEECFKILAPLCAKRQGEYRTFNNECEFKAENKQAKPPYKFVDDVPCESDPIIMD